MKKKRLIFVQGPWQLIVSGTALRECHETSDTYDNHLILYAPAGSEGLQVTLKKMAPHLWSWTSIAYVESPQLGVNHDSLQDSLEGYYKEIYSAVGSKNADEIWLCKLDNPAEKFFAAAFPEARIIFFEDGLHTYVPWPEEKLKFRLKTKIHVLRDRVSRKVPHKMTSAEMTSRVADLSVLQRLAGSYLLLSDRLGVPNYISHRMAKTLPNRALLSSIQKCGHLVDTGNFKIKPEKTCLVLGQCYARWGFVPRAQELQIYSEIVGDLLERGYQVLWKDHPRLDQGFFPEIQSAYGEKVGRFEMDNRLPVELGLLHFRPELCVSSTSTSLLLLDRLFDIECRTFAEKFAPFLSGDFLTMTHMCSDHVNGLF